MDPDVGPFLPLDQPLRKGHRAVRPSETAWVFRIPGLSLFPSLSPLLLVILTKEVLFSQGYSQNLEKDRNRYNLCYVLNSVLFLRVLRGSLHIDGSPPMPSPKQLGIPMEGVPCEFQETSLATNPNSFMPMSIKKNT